MQIKEYAEADSLNDGDLFLIQKGDETGEYKKIKSENLSFNNSGNSTGASNNYFRGTVEPVEATDGFVWDELDRFSNFIQRWIRSNNEWVGNPFEINYSLYSNSNSTFIYRIDKRFHLLIYAYEIEIWNLSGKQYPSGSPPIQFSVRVCDIELFDPFAQTQLFYIGYRNLRDKEREIVKDFSTNKKIHRSSIDKHLVVNTIYLNNTWYGLTTCKLYCVYVR